MISALMALALFAAPETTAAGAPAEPAKPATRKVCYETEVSGSRLPKKVCRTETVKPSKPDAEKTASEAKPATDQPS